MLIVETDARMWPMIRHSVRTIEPLMHIPIHDGGQELSGSEGRVWPRLDGVRQTAASGRLRRPKDERDA